MSIVVVALIVTGVMLALVVLVFMGGQRVAARVQAQTDLAAIGAAQVLSETSLVGRGHQVAPESVSAACNAANMLVAAAGMDLTACEHVGSGRVRVEVVSGTTAALAVAGPKP